MEMYLTTTLNGDVIRITNGLKWADYNYDGVRIAQGKSWSVAPTEEELAIWDEAVKTVKLPSTPVKNIYIRFNDLPKNNISYNHATNQPEKGLSCYNAKYNLKKQCYEISEGGLPGAMLQYMISGAKVYLLTGDYVCNGSDGEPVITNVKVIGQLLYDDKIDGYIVKEDK